MSLRTELANALDRLSVCERERELLEVAQSEGEEGLTRRLADVEAAARRVVEDVPCLAMPLQCREPRCSVCELAARLRGAPSEARLACT